MQIKVTYNKSTGDITLEHDTKLITLELNENATEDNANTLSFEVAVDTSAYEEAQMEAFGETFEEIQE